MRWPWTAKPEQRTASLEATLLALRPGFPSPTGIWVDTMAALTNDVCWACTALLSDVISSFPAQEFQQVGDVRERVAAPSRIVTNPSGYLEVPEWLGQIVVGLCHDGNTVGQIVARDFAGHPTQCEIRAWSDVSVIRDTKTSAPRYKLDGKVVETTDIVHWRGSVLRPGQVVAESPIEAARNAIASALATERFGAEFFGAGGHLSALLSSEQQIEGEVADLIKARFLAATRNHEPAVLGKGLTYTALQADPQQSQMIEAQRAVAERVVRFFRLRPEMIGISTGGSSITYANRTDRAEDFVQLDLIGWIRPIETRWSTMTTRPRFVRLNLDALLRSDILTRYRVYDIGLRNGTLNRNEVRARENAAPIPDGDVYLDPATSSAASTGGLDATAKA